MAYSRQLSDKVFDVYMQAKEGEPECAAEDRGRQIFALLLECYMLGENRDLHARIKATLPPVRGAG